MNQIPPAAADAIDDIVEAFEQARHGDGATRLTDFLPPPSHPEFRAIAAELIRVDMEYSWEGGAGDTVDSYRQLLPDVLSDAATLASIAFEEYRLRALAGQPVGKEEFARTYSIPVDDWPQFGVARERAAESSDPAPGHGCLDDAWRDALQLADSVADFPVAGDAIAGFELVEELGRGAFARVFLARQRELAERPVALKIAAGQSLEPQHLARLQHTNIVPIYSVHTADGFTAVCMPYFGSRTLADVNRELAGQPSLPASGAALVSTVQAGGEPTWAERAQQSEAAVAAATEGVSHDAAERLRRRSYVDAVLDVMRQAAEGLAHAHARGIVHRDLKPANILLADDARPLLLDFNLSESVVVNGRPALTAGGTLPYMSPEQLQAVRGGGGVDRRSDIYSLGVMLYELLAGRRPFPDRSGLFEQLVAQAIADRQQAPVDLRQRNPAAPPAAASIVAKCLATDADQRYQTADELAEDLRRHLNHRPLRYAANSSLVERLSKWTRRHPRASSGGTIAAAAAVVLTAAALLGLRWSAADRFEEFQNALPQARSALTVAEADPQLIQQGIEFGKQTLAGYKLSEDSGLQRNWAVRALGTKKVAQLRTDVAELAYLLAEATARAAAAGDDKQLVVEAARWNELASATFGADAPAAVAAQAEMIAHLAEESGDVRQRVAMRQRFAPGDPQALMLSDLRLAASRLLSDREFRAAMPYLRELRNRTPQDASAWLMLGNGYAALGEDAQAELSYDASAALLPAAGTFAAVLNRGLSRLRQQEYEQAISDFSDVIRRRPDLACGYLNRGLARAALGQHAEAIDDYSHALELGVRQTRIHFLLARSWQALGSADKAQQCYQTGLQLTPTDATSWVARGVARLGADPAGALADFRAALQVAPGDLSALHNMMVVAAERLGQPQVAREAASEILDIQPDNAAALAGRAVIAARQGDRAAALADVSRLLEASDAPMHYFQAACVLSLTSAQQAADAEQAAAYLLRALVAQPALAARADADPDLAALRDSPRYSEVLRAVEAATAAVDPATDESAPP
ncbi:MAG: hypothetical protein CMJ58_28155 [Planctomycetaceae bacterium]|nr:hypothetical protein [Planctomycetaceae bacterium]